MQGAVDIVQEAEAYLTKKVLVEKYLQPLGLPDRQPLEKEQKVIGELELSNQNQYRYLG